jgi:hypothetical protein
MEPFYNNSLEPTADAAAAASGAAAAAVVQETKTDDSSSAPGVIDLTATTTPSYAGFPFYPPCIAYPGFSYAPFAPYAPTTTHPTTAPALTSTTAVMPLSHPPSETTTQAPQMSSSNIELLKAMGTTPNVELLKAMGSTHTSTPVSIAPRPAMQRAAYIPTRPTLPTGHGSAAPVSDTTSRSVTLAPFPLPARPVAGATTAAAQPEITHPSTLNPPPPVTVNNPFAKPSMTAPTNPPPTTVNNPFFAKPSMTAPPNLPSPTLTTVNNPFAKPAITTTMTIINPFTTMTTTRPATAHNTAHEVFSQASLQPIAPYATIASTSPVIVPTRVDILLPAHLPQHQLWPGNLALDAWMHQLRERYETCVTRTEQANLLSRLMDRIAAHNGRVLTLESRQRTQKGPPSPLWRFTTDSETFLFLAQTMIRIVVPSRRKAVQAASKTIRVHEQEHYLAPQTGQPPVAPTPIPLTPMPPTAAVDRLMPLMLPPAANGKKEVRKKTPSQPRLSGYLKKPVPIKRPRPNTRSIMVDDPLFASTDELLILYSTPVFSYSLCRRTKPRKEVGDTGYTGIKRAHLKLHMEPSELLAQEKGGGEQEDEDDDDDSDSQSPEETLPKPKKARKATVARMNSSTSSKKHPTLMKKSSTASKKSVTAIKKSSTVIKQRPYTVMKKSAPVVKKTTSASSNYSRTEAAAHARSQKSFDSHQSSLLPKGVTVRPSGKWVSTYCCFKELGLSLFCGCINLILRCCLFLSHHSKPKSILLARRGTLVSFRTVNTPTLHSPRSVNTCNPFARVHRMVSIPRKTCLP